MDVVTVGESMVLFEPNENGLIQYTDHFKKRIGGAESNVAIGLSKLGHSVSWISRLGDDPFGRYIYSFIRGEGVDVSQVKFDSNANTGIYFKQTGGFNQTSIYYYRQQSAASFLNHNDMKEDVISKARFLHITGITPALSQSCYETVIHAIKIARKHNVKVVFDPNIRTKLWDSSDYIPILKVILKMADFFLPGEDELKLLFPNEAPDEIIAKVLKFGVSTIIVKNGAAGATYHTKSESQHVSGYPNEHVKDPVGAGDGFAAGFISGLIEDLSLSDSVKRGNLIGSMVTMVHGDCEGLPSRQEVLGFEKKTSDVHR
ncbi:2-dehydro-3-deoxygluconokinase [Bacillus pakistanensis]|uniref:2-dehydro-3-deoxygluconokinase n=1 Tax=Rossellomorea pakistanensis TaxID=992288 RepID=A0ABS2NHU2_9BACI|nr:sugar kinase [Bacillus pakistanensis]MBM7587436.1 2-dehydro-3-deoxygluconokinase [Bacillus pakistanensis]